LLVDLKCLSVGHHRLVLPRVDDGQDLFGLGRRDPGLGILVHLVKGAERAAKRAIVPVVFHERAPLGHPGTHFGRHLEAAAGAAPAGTLRARARSQKQRGHACHCQLLNGSIHVFGPFVLDGQQEKRYELLEAERLDGIEARGF
jgi:hypothetical protein